MKKFIWPLLIIFFLLGGLAAILIGQVYLPPDPRPVTVEEISEKWDQSGHSDAENESFIHWNEDDPAEIPVNCAKCHSAYGYRDYLGEDGSEVNVVDSSAAIGSVISCFVCHNPAAHEKSAASFPSGDTIENLGGNSNCAECHQGTRAGTNVDAAIMNLPEDEVDPDLRFINVHYKIGGAIRYGSEVHVGYEYPGMSYIGFYPHVDEYQLCSDCHDPHELLVSPIDCASCHPAVSGFENIRSVRINGTPDFDGDGDNSEGIYGEITTIHNILYSAIKTYADEIVDQPIIYVSQFPYWFNDTNGNGTVDQDEINFGNQYASWTPRLVKATYNYHLVLEDPGGFMHNARYLIQLMVDTISNLAETISLENVSLIRPE